MNGRYCYLEEDVERREGGDVLANYEQKGLAASTSLHACWNCNLTEHQAKKCPISPSAKLRDRIEESDQKIALYKAEAKGQASLEFKQVRESLKTARHSTKT